MGWKTISGRRYYYRTERVDGRVESSYVGGGEFGRACALRDFRERHKRNIEAAREMVTREESAAVDAAIRDACKAARSAAEATLRAAGCHKPWGKWRRKRKGFDVGDQIQQEQPAAAPARPIARFFEAYPDGWAKAVFGIRAGGESKNPKPRDRMEQAIEDLARELAGPDPTPIEKTLAETAALAWAGLRWAEIEAYGYENGSVAQRLWRDRRLTAASRRYLATLKTLATVRRLAVSVLIGQVNIAAKGSRVVNQAAVATT